MQKSQQQIILKFQIGEEEKIDVPLLPHAGHHSPKQNTLGFQNSGKGLGIQLFPANQLVESRCDHKLGTKHLHSYLLFCT